VLRRSHPSQLTSVKFMNSSLHGILYSAAPTCAAGATAPPPSPASVSLGVAPDGMPRSSASSCQYMTTAAQPRPRGLEWGERGSEGARE
jgi:hypothetical protein